MYLILNFDEVQYDSVATSQQYRSSLFGLITLALTHGTGIYDS